MTWQDFLNKQADIQGLSVEEKTTLLTALPDQDTQINQTQLSLKLSITEATVKSRLKEIYKNFQSVCPELGMQQGAGKFEILRKYLKQKYHQSQSNDIIKNPNHDKSISPEFQSLIDEKIQSFCGRRFVFTAFETFINTNKKGYFTVIGDAGMGKSTIAAKYVSENNAICYFNVLVDGRNRPELFLESIRKQLINRHQLANVENADLSTLLVKATEKLSENEKLIIVVDALDEVDQEAGAENILFLPKTLPDNVYFLLTRRRYEPSKKRLYTEGVKQEELDLTDKKYDSENAKDIQEYIRLCLNNDPEHKTGLQNWIENKNITPDAFVNELATKSENNFMYLRYVLPAIAEGKYNDLNLTKLPQGLHEYYVKHWERMKMNDEAQKMKVIVLYILVEFAKPIPCEKIAAIAEQDEYEVEKILDEWIEYLRKRTEDGYDCYSIYHASFLNFLKPKKELNLEKRKQLLQEVNQKILTYYENIENNHG
ncbi:ATP-binding protein [Trichormus sp. NMC-1]|uniref:ATP-binding protein n=1 Tax=Trichormus sp. NMC-1 TaxID=1853259 RepID=UPI000ACF6ACE|nr:ATP-binding protein [Trichormus sp. NMC-1]